jgi:hypothetical protein
MAPFIESRARRRLAAEVRAHAGTEAELLRRAGVVDFREISRRAALYELIALRLEAVDLPVESPGVERVRRLLEQGPRRERARGAADVWAPALLALDPELSQARGLLRAS